MASSKSKRRETSEKKTSAKKPFNVFHWFVLGIVCGIGLGIIISLSLSAISLATTEWPHGPPSWEVIKWYASRAAIMCGMYGAVLGGFVGIVIGVVRGNWE